MVTYAHVKTVADEIAASGGEVGTRAVQRRTRGSFRDVCKHLATWRELHPAPSCGAVPPDMISRAEHERILADAEARIESERRHLMMQTDAIRQGIAAPHLAKISKLEARISELEKELLIAEAQRDEAERRAAAAAQATNQR